MTTLLILTVLAILFSTAAYMARHRATQASLPIAPLTEQEQELAERLRRHVGYLAETIGERNLWHYPQLDEAAGYIETELQSYGFTVKRQTYSAYDKESHNLVAEIVGSTRPEEILLIGAHYDSVAGTPGANDNASGVATLLELARQLAGSRPALTLRLVAFVNEEPPFFKSEKMGSLVYARAARERGDKIVAMICLETLGYYTQLKKSQQFPVPLMRLFYPNSGNFLTFATNLSSRNLLNRSLQAFRSSSNFPAEGVVAPGWLPGVDWSDHWSFWQIDVPAIMLTDTALYRYHHYHSSQDKVEKLSYPEFARAVAGISKMVAELAK